MDNTEKNETPENGMLFEDLVQYANQWQSGAHPSGRNMGKKLTVLDLLRLDADGGDEAPNILPFQMSSFVDAVGDSYLQVVELQQMVASAYKSSLTQDTTKIKKGLIKINKNLQKQKELIKNCGKLIDKLSH